MQMADLGRRAVAVASAVVPLASAPAVAQTGSAPGVTPSTDGYCPRGESGRGFGDYEQHEQVATRLGAHFTRSDENRQSQPNSEAIENSQIRTSDGNVIVTPGLFWTGISITDVKYRCEFLRSM